MHGVGPLGLPPPLDGVLRAEAAQPRKVAVTERLQVAQHQRRHFVAHGHFDASQVLFDGPTTSLVDFDTVCVTNGNRQLHATAKTVGKPKAELMAQRCKEINPDAQVQGLREFYRRAFALGLIPRQPELRFHAHS